MAKNPALVLHPNLDLKIEERPVPSIKSDEVLLNMKRTGICGTDLHLWSHGSAGIVSVTKSMVLGHESSGIVIQVGSQVTNLKEGDRVCVEPFIPCSTCDYCIRGNYNHCPNLEGRGYPADGMCVRYYSHPARFVHKLPDNVSLDEGALVEPLSVAVNGCRRADLKAGQNILICGAGPVGVLSMLCAKAMGAKQVCISDVRQQRLDIAKSLGADHVILVSDDRDLSEQVLEIFGDLADVTIDCCGSAQTVPPAVLATRKAGVLAIIGMGGDEATLSMKHLVTRELDIRGVFLYPNCFPIALSLLASGSVNVKPLVTHSFEQQEALKAFNLAFDPDSGAMKVMLNISE